MDYGDIREMRRFLREVEKRLDRFYNRDAAPEETAKTVPNLLTRFDFPKDREELYEQRLVHGLKQLYIRKFGIVLAEDTE